MNRASSECVKCRGYLLLRHIREDQVDRFWVGLLIDNVTPELDQEIFF